MVEKKKRYSECMCTLSDNFGMVHEISTMGLCRGVLTLDCNFKTWAICAKV